MQNIERGGLIYWSELYEIINKSNDIDNIEGCYDLPPYLREEVLDCLFYPARQVTGVCFDEWEEVDINHESMDKFINSVEISIKKTKNLEAKNWLNGLKEFILKARDISKDISVSL